MSRFKVPNFRAIRKETKDWYTPCSIIGGEVKPISEYYAINEGTLEMMINGKWYKIEDINSMMSMAENISINDI